jgi:hypothetical protein
MNGEWDVVFPKPQESHQDALRRWYYASTPAQEARGDLACMDFDTYVSVYLVEDPADELIEFDLDDLSPIDHALIIFYSEARYGAVRLFVLGALTWSTIVDTFSGQVPVQELHKYRTRFFIAPELEPEPLPAPPAIYVPGTRIRFLSGLNKALTRTIQWYFDTNKSDPRSTVYSTVDHALGCFWADYIADAIIADQPPANDIAGRALRTSYDHRIIRRQFDQVRLQKERAFYRMCFFEHQRFTQDLLCMLDVSGITNFQIIDNPTLADMKMGLSLPYWPTYFLDVPAETVPPPIQHSIYEGGRAHIPLTAQFVFEWTWFQYEQRVLRRPTLIREALPLPIDLKPFVKMVKKLLVSTPPKNVFSSRSTKSDALESDGIVDIEDLWKASPPCMTRLRQLGRFPRNNERVRGAQIWERSRVVTIETQKRAWSALNDRYPKDGMTLKQRFDVVATIDSLHDGDRVYCKNVIRNTIEERADHLICPYVDTSGGGDFDGIQASCRVRCSNKEFLLKSPSDYVAYHRKGLTETKKEHDLICSESSDSEEEEEHDGLDC